MLSIDEAIEQFKYDAECNRADLDLSYAEENEQVAEWLEELKAYREKKCNKSVYLASKSVDKIDAVNKGYADGYNKAIDDFVKACENNQLFPMYGGYVYMTDIKEIAEKLKR